MTSIVALFPLSWQTRAKAIVSLLGTILTVSSTVVALPVWATITLGVLTVAGTYATPALGYVAPYSPPKHGKP